jgi:hypothetical protein
MRSGGIRPSFASSGTSIWKALIASASSRTGASDPACSGSGSRSTSRSRKPGGPTARWTGSGRLKLHIDHLGRHGGGTGVTDDAAFADLKDTLALAKYPNVAIKMSGAPSYSSLPYPYKNIHGYLRQIFEAFGPERSFWGTDITRMPCSYRQCVTMFTEELPWLKDRDLERVMGGAVVDWLGWKRPGGQA